MILIKRQRYRINLLKEVYEYYFSNNGEALNKEIKDGEEKLAYIYLQNKKYINMSGEYNNQNIAILPDGIDLIENTYK